VIMCGKANGMMTLVMYFHLENPYALATFLWSCGMEATQRQY
jgi:hypothetical protein